MLKISLKFAGTLMVLVSLASLVPAQPQNRVYREGGGWAEEITGSLPAAKNLRVKVDVGSVRIVGGSQQGINYVVRNHAYNSSEDKARREFDSYKISAYIRGETAWVVGEWQGGKLPSKCSAEFVINTPRQMELVKVETEGGSVSATGIAGRADAQSGGGSIHLDDIGGAINAESGGGSVVLISGLQGAVLETGGGSIQVKKCTGSVKATTGGGSIDLGDIGGPAEIETGGGSIRLGSAKGLVRAETGGGSIELNGVPAARAETGAGGIVAKFVASSGERTDSVLETSAGDITVYLASDLAITIRASIELANGHNIRSDFPDIHVRTEGGDYGPKTVSADGRLNGGGPVLKVRATTGDITFRRTSR